MDVWQQVQVTGATHPRNGQAGVVHACNRVTHPNAVVVKFDVDGTIESVDLVDLKAL